MDRYTTVSLPSVFHKKLSSFIKENPQLGYGSVAEFAKEAIRLRITEVKSEAQIIALRKLRDMPYRNWEEKWESFRGIEANSE
ncbi:MAG: hypothetical protein U9O96_06075 [Candidatus Thermoplasmatota archaeon]|nr:hypothetical protein [Candidatus Thermoplasmatota archaeon]